MNNIYIFISIYIFIYIYIGYNIHITVVFMSVLYLSQHCICVATVLISFMVFSLVHEVFKYFSSSTVKTHNGSEFAQNTLEIQWKSAALCRSWTRSCHYERRFERYKIILLFIWIFSTRNTKSSAERRGGESWWISLEYFCYVRPRLQLSRIQRQWTDKASSTVSKSVIVLLQLQFVGT